MRGASRKAPGSNRRAFLRGAAGVSLALPFLESLPERSAWAAGDDPIFSLFICTACGVVPERFFPDSTGPLTQEGLTAAGKATSQLAVHANDLLFLSGIDWTFPNLGDAHSLGYCQVLTASEPDGSGPEAKATGPSADVVIASHVHPDLAPLTLYAGDKRNAYMAERLSFTQQGTIAPAIDNPYTLYLELAGLVQPGGGMTPDGANAARLLLESRKSLHDLVREELMALMQHPRLSAEDRQRLDLHFSSIRDAEVTMSGTGDEMLNRCTAAGVDVTKLEALKNYAYDPYTTTEETARLHLSLVALAFACNYRRTATLQWGDGLDRTVYRVPSNERGWSLSWITHRGPSDSYSGTPDPLAAQAHAEIDVVRLRSFAAGLDSFKARELENRCFVMWTNHFRDGPAHNFNNVPHILWGNAGGYLKTGEYIDVGNVTNDRLLNTLITAAIQDTGTTVEDFGDGEGGLLDAVIA
jgi:hypothetical protein